MDRWVKQNLIWAAVSFFGLLTICILLKPASLSANSGISYFGNYKQTLLPYAGALLLAAYFLHQMVLKLKPGKLFTVRVLQALGGIPILMAALVLVPSNAGALVNWAHDIIGAAIFIIQLAIAAYWYRYHRSDKKLLGLLGLELVMGVAAAVYVPVKTGFLIETQLVFQAAFMITVGYVLKKYPD